MPESIEKSSVSTPHYSPTATHQLSILKEAYTESIGISPELTRIFYINPVRYEKYDII
jgi:hypothetical protein